LKAVWLILFAILFVIGVVWNFRCHCLFCRLRDDHPSTFERLGRPSIFWRRGNTWLLMKFVFSNSESSELNDPDISETIRFMRRLFVCFLLLFVTLAILLPFIPRVHRAH
jgi:hypothetical protein